MKKHRNQFGGKHSQGKKVRPGNVLAKRYQIANFEQLERRELLTVSATGASYEMLSMRSLLASAARFGGTTQPTIHSNTASNSSSNSAPVVPLTQSVDTNHEDSVTTPEAPTANPLADANDVIKFRMQVRNTNDQDIDVITVGQDYQIAVFVNDIRTDKPAQSNGVFAAYMNIAYDSSRSGITATPHDANTGPDPGIVFDPFWTLVKRGELGTAGQIQGAGASTSTFPFTTSNEQLLFRITVHATAAGTQTFTPSFDSTSGHDTLLYLNDNPITADQIEFVSDTITIAASTTPEVTITPSVSQNEGNSGVTPFVFTASLSAVSGQQVTVPFATAPGTATFPADFAALSGTLTFAPGTTTQLITINVNGDTIDEDNESFTVALSAPVNATLGATSTGTATIQNDDTAPVVSISSVTSAEGNSGTTNQIFTVTLSSASGKTVTVPFATANGTATVAGDDYEATSGTLTFAPTETQKLITVTVNGDTVREPNETYNVNLSAPTNATLSEAASQGIGTINNDDGPRISVTLVDGPKPEGNSGTTDFVFKVDLGQADPDQAVTVVYQTQDGTATTADDDYDGASGTLTFAPNETQKLITVTVNGDTKNEANETFSLNLSSPSSNASLLNPIASATINNDDTAPAMTVTAASATEGNSGTTPMVFTVSLSNPSGQQVTAVYTAIGDTATTADNDFVATTGTVTFAPGATTALVTININGDSKNEANETFTLQLSNPSGATLVEATDSATGTINNDDAVPTLTLVGVANPEGLSGTKSFVFTATLSAASGQAITANFATSDGTANAGEDYVATSGTISFAPGTTSQLITVTVNGDTKNEANETFSLNISGTDDSKVTVATPSVTGTISNDDALPQISVANAAQNEGDAGNTPLVFTVTLSNASSQQVTVVYNTADLSATVAGNDYEAASGTITFAPGVTSQLITVNIKGDSVNEADETFTVNLSAPSNATIDDGIAAGTITNNDPVPTVAIADVTGNEGDSGNTPFVFTVTLSAASGQNVVVAYSTAGITATTADNDFLAASGSITFTPGTTTQTITVQVVGDTFIEPNETFRVQLLSATNATVADGIGTGTITNESTDSTPKNLPSTISGFAVIDVDNGSDFDSGEQVFAGRTVSLTGTSSVTQSNVTMTATVGTDGKYTFTGVDPGTYTVTLVQPSGYYPVHVAVGSQGGQALSSGLGFTMTIAQPGGLTGTNNNFYSRGALIVASTPPATDVSMRLYLASNRSNTSAQSAIASPQASSLAATNDAAHASALDAVASSLASSTPNTSGITSLAKLAVASSRGKSATDAAIEQQNSWL